MPRWIEWQDPANGSVGGRQTEQHLVAGGRRHAACGFDRDGDGLHGAWRRLREDLGAAVARGLEDAVADGLSRHDRPQLIRAPGSGGSASAAKNRPRDALT